MVYLIAILAIAAGRGLIPAAIAERKGYRFSHWWLYGGALFLVAIIHVALLPDRRVSTPNSISGLASDEANSPGT